MQQIARTTRQIGDAIRRYRRRAKLSQLELGHKVHLRQATISSLENGEPGVGLRTLIDVVTALNLELVIRDRSSANKAIEEIF